MPFPVDIKETLELSQQALRPQGKHTFIEIGPGTHDN